MVNKFPTFSSSQSSSGFLREESLRVAKYVRVLGLQEVLLFNSMVSKLLLMVTRQASNNWLFARVLSELTNRVAKTSEIQLHRVNCFTVVQSDLKSAVAGTYTTEVIFFDSSVDHVLATWNLLESVRLSLRRQISNNKIYYFWRGIVCARVVLETWVASDKVIAGEESLFDCFGLVAGDIDNFDCIGGGRGISLELNLIDISFVVVALQNLTRTTFWIVIQTNALLLLNAIFKCLVYLSALRNWDWTNTRVVVLDACECFSERSIALVVSLFKNLRS